MLAPFIHKCEWKWACSYKIIQSSSRNNNNSVNCLIFAAFMFKSNCDTWNGFDRKKRWHHIEWVFSIFCCCIFFFPFDERQQIKSTKRNEMKWNKMNDGDHAKWSDFQSTQAYWLAFWIWSNLMVIHGWLKSLKSWLSLFYHESATLMSRNMNAPDTRTLLKFNIGSNLRIKVNAWPLRPDRGKGNPRQKESQYHWLQINFKIDNISCTLPTQPFI